MQRNLRLYLTGLLKRVRKSMKFAKSGLWNASVSALIIQH
jgi:hypothetical protein